MLRTRKADNRHDVESFFDAAADCYIDRHGEPQRLLKYRLSIIERLIGPSQRDVLLEIGCGTGIHLLALADRFQRVIGTDLSSNMIALAESSRARHARKDAIELSVDPAETLVTIQENSIDVVLCVGAFEHMLDKSAVLAQVYRVLKPGGVFICLTPNGDYAWYAWVAPFCDIDTRHLSTDRFINGKEVLSKLRAACLKPESPEYWTFIPRGDIPSWVNLLLVVLDRAGRLLGLSRFRGGLCFRAFKST